MKVFLIVATSADGFIARDHDELANWTSKEDKRLFVNLTKEAGVVVMGGSTFRTIGRPLPGRRNIVYSKQTIVVPDIEVTNEQPGKLVNRLKHEGAKAVAVCGGRTVYDMFLAAGVVDELYLTVEPVLFGQGVTLAGSSLKLPLTLIDNKLLNDNTMLLHYGVGGYVNNPKTRSIPG